MTMKRPLEGIRVIDFGWRAVAPIGARMLAWGGAEVIRVETASRHDGARLTPPQTPGKESSFNTSAWFNNLNSNKMSISLNLRKPLGKDLALRLVTLGDVVTENFSAGVMDRLGLGYEDLRKVCPDIIMISHSLAGIWGPNKRISGHGPMGAAMAGFHSIAGWPDMDPISPGAAYTDFITNAHQSSFVLMAALLHRRRTGEGQYIDLSQIEAVINNTGTMMLDYTANGRIMDRLGNRDELAAPHGIYQCRGDEQWCAIAVFSQEDWERLAGVMGRPELIHDSRFSTFEGRKANEDTLDEIVEEWTSQLDAQGLTVLLQEAGIPAGAVQNAREVMEDPQIIARNHFRRVVHSEAGETTYDGPPFRFSETDEQEVLAAPMLGEHNDWVFNELLGLGEEEVISGYVDEVFV